MVKKKLVNEEIDLSRHFSEIIWKKKVKRSLYYSL